MTSVMIDNNNNIRLGKEGGKWEPENAKATYYE